MLKTRLLSLAILLGLLSAPFGAQASVNQISAEPFNPYQQDKQLHMAASYGMALTGTMILRKNDHSLVSSILFSSLATLAVGAAKEAYLDREFSQGDMVANTIGVGANLLVSTTFSF